VDLYDGSGAVATVNKTVPFFKSSFAPLATVTHGAKAVAAETVESDRHWLRAGRLVFVFGV
jgi:hypothetical protein